MFGFPGLDPENSLHVAYAVYMYIFMAILGLVFLGVVIWMIGVLGLAIYTATLRTGQRIVSAVEQSVDSCIACVRPKEGDAQEDVQPEEEDLPEGMSGLSVSQVGSKDLALS
ncbi:hypothetical protein ACJZTR_00435 [Neorickettsia risticii]|uniref:Uncharacterized protein n=1 Tax=Neorickettsia risticii (strain Illinois) TaxID=434131 RepID=C6V3Y7_NEORI|nr:hypothetical protein [Neorickettsia risticii]ACT69089.1 hypothetical protein NRI_0106 [Neorickettsia risticii str. Illinois]